MGSLQRVLLPVVLTGMTALFAGCLALGAGAVAGAAGVAYVRGSLDTTLNAPVPEVAAATRSALEEMGIPIASERVSALDARITGRTARDDRVRIDLDRKGENITALSIRVGVFGDKEQSMAIYNRILQHLGSS